MFLDFPFPSNYNVFLIIMKSKNRTKRRLRGGALEERYLFETKGGTFVSKPIQSFYSQDINLRAYECVKEKGVGFREVPEIDADKFPGPKGGLRVMGVKMRKEDNPQLFLMIGISKNQRGEFKYLYCPFNGGDENYFVEYDGDYELKPYPDCSGDKIAVNMEECMELAGRDAESYVEDPRAREGKQRLAYATGLMDEKSPLINLDFPTGVDAMRPLGPFFASAVAEGGERETRKQRPIVCVIGFGPNMGIPLSLNLAMDG